ncbi:TetR/AcrR family transcriptional regulator [Actinocrispum wychmicini]|uniref:TetR/AcrR family transcriptional regulator n=1 Tax=Actinocrispum wychmicini TaxID=1213861 RepID=UPI001046290A|nr:TetR family transcriptional regulator C-terminal domain-containing protein [Actinocrispum wychmicini]
MPKIVDPDQRRQAVAEAVFQVVARDGVEQASLRNVAVAAGLAIGSVRHYFTSAAEMTAFAMREIRDRVFLRVLEHAAEILDDPTINRRAATERLLAELLPLDAGRMQEAVLWLDFAAAARTRPELRAVAREQYEDTRALLTRVLAEAQQMGGLTDQTDVDAEAARLHALLDGLAMAAVLHPDRMRPDDMRAALHRHIDELAGGK